MLTHLLLLMTSLAVLSVLIPYPWPFALLTTVLAMGCIGISHWGNHWRSLGTWIFIPALYVAYDHPSFLLDITASPLLLLPLAGPFLLLRTKKRVEIKQSSTHSMTNTVYATVGLGCAVLICSLWVAYHRPPHGQWIIWSSMSVSMVDISGIYKKLKTRILGAFTGGGIGVALMALHPAHYVATIGSLLIPLTLAMRPYGVSFASRCLLIVISAGAFQGSQAVLIERVMEVVAGGILGALFTHIGLYLCRRRPALL
ncbi:MULTISPECIES: FUSC family protein [Aeromonas]|uniref:FUSC family protein n=1 Tax=Aeromonas TaxID=642 RepID=UPI00132F890C|nr:FUSC family protein [Aeromonas salmonicida]